MLTHRTLWRIKQQDSQNKQRVSLPVLSHLCNTIWKYWSFQSPKWKHKSTKHVQLTPILKMKICKPRWGRVIEKLQLRYTYSYFARVHDYCNFFIHDLVFAKFARVKRTNNLKSSSSDIREDLFEIYMLSTALTAITMQNISACYSLHILCPTNLKKCPLFDNTAISLSVASQLASA